MTLIDERQARERDHRWNLAWALVLYGLLLPATVTALARWDAGWGDRLVTLALVAGLALWHGWMVLAHPHWWERALLPMGLYFTGLLGFTVALLQRDAAFVLLAVACYPTAFVTLPGRWAYAGVVAATLAWAAPLGLPATAQERTTLVIAAGTTLLTGMIGGMIRVMEREAVRRREANAALAAANTRLAALAEENAELHAQLLEQARDAGVAAERARLAREIHDTVAQALAGIVAQLEAADEQEEVPAPVRGRLEATRELAREGLVEVRRSVDALRPGPLEGGRLGEAVGHAVATWQRQHGRPATATVTGTPRPLHPEVELAVLRAAQEALANAGRHAAASQVSVTLSYMDDVVVLDVRDDGRGFDPAAAGGGFGLTAMRQRVRRLAGKVEIESAPGAGTVVSVTVPAIGPAEAMAGAEREEGEEARDGREGGDRPGDPAGRGR